VNAGGKRSLYSRCCGEGETRACAKLGLRKSRQTPDLSSVFHDCEYCDMLACLLVALHCIASRDCIGVL